MSSYLKTVENNIAKASSSNSPANNRLSNGSNGNSSSSSFKPVDPSIPPLRLPTAPPPTSSKFWQTSGPKKPVILVNDSSPERPQSSYVPHQSHFAQFAYGAAPPAQHRSGIYQDPFLSSTFKPNARPRPSTEDAGEPPRKKQNVNGRPKGVILVNDTPESSPELYRYSTGRNVIMSPQEEPESPGPNRLRRGRPEGNGGGLIEVDSPTPSYPQFASPAMGLTALTNTFPGLSEEEINRAFYEYGHGDYRTAFGICSEIEKKKNSSYAKSVIAQQEAEKREKELAKQRKNKSAIYANRDTLQSQAPSTPIQQKKRRLDDSDSDEDDFQGDGFNSDDSEAGDRTNDAELDAICTVEALEYFNTADAEGLVMMLACTPEQAATMVGMRPFHSVEDVERKMVRRSGVTIKLFENYKDLLKGYKAVDAVLQRCERIGQDIDDIQLVWHRNSDKRPVKTEIKHGVIMVDDDDLERPEPISKEDQPVMQNYIWDPPQSLASDVKLKEYQMLGLNWLNLLHSRNHSCILADEMGLGKTIQVIAFLTHLKDTGVRDKFLIVVPASTLENWIREFHRFSPGMRVVSYYGSIVERAGLRKQFSETMENWDVMITTYNFAQGGGNDSKFFKKIPWSIAVFDEGHVVKNYQSQRYHALMKIRAKWRLLLTGTPLQNNLQELLSLMNFILPRLFTDVVESFRAIFKVKPGTQAGMLAHDRVSRAKQMMSPFVLRRRKDQVLKELPKKTERIEWCGMTSLQQEIYHQTMQRSRRVLMEESEEEDELAIAEAGQQKGRGKKKVVKAKQQDLSSNVLMDLRKATAHPMLFRRLFSEETIKAMAKACLTEPEFQESKLELVIEDMAVMTDAELDHFCQRYKSVRKFALDKKRYLECGKVEVLLKLLEEYTNDGRRVLIFSQFTQILDILKTILDYKSYKYLLLTGSTAVDERQGLVDEFNDDPSIKVFLLSTKAGGMGINLTAASVVITYDLDFNPHNDLQASDRAYRIGQTRDVDVIKLITKGTIEQDILQLANTKLTLDEAIAGDEEVQRGVEREVKKSLIGVLRKKLEQEDDVANGNVRVEVNEEAKMESNGKNGIKTKPGMKEVKMEIKEESGSGDFGQLEQIKREVGTDVLSALPAALLAAKARQSESGSASPASSFRNDASPSSSLRAEETPPATQSPTPLPTPPEARADTIMMDD